VVDEFNLDDLFEKDVDLSTAISRKVVIVYHTHKLLVSNVVDLLGNFANHNL
jgi:hypothetical protein